MYYHTTTVDHGESTELTDGGYYERVSNGTPELITAGEYAGFKQSQTPQVCAATDAAGSLFAAVQHGTPGTYHVYTTTHEPDVNLTKSTLDFGLFNEVRYNNPSETPVSVSHHDTITVPERAIRDVNLTYLPPGPHIIREWGTAIKSLFADTLLHDGTYPDDATNVVTVQRPDPDAYQAV